LSKHRAGVEAIRLLDKFGIVGFTGRRIQELSKGIQQKLQFIAASLHDPEVIILDEPFTGLDPVNQMVLRDLIKQFKEEGKVVILSSHNMTEVEQLSDTICLINQGQILLHGPMEKIKQKYTDDTYYIESDDDLSFLHELEYIKIIEEHNRSFKFTTKAEKSKNKNILGDILSRLNVKKFYRMEPTLNDIFIDLIQKEKSEK
jgi:ABC-2 type transport system ATP-binding protein